MSDHLGESVAKTQFSLYFDNCAADVPALSPWNGGVSGDWRMERRPRGRV